MRDPPPVLLLCHLLLCIRGSASNSSQPFTVTAIPGGRALLPCDIEVPIGANDIPVNRSIGSISLILWYHGDFRSRGGMPIYSLDALDQPLSRARPSPTGDYSNRAYFDVLARPPVLKIDPVLEADAGEYRCRADYVGQPSQNRVVRLNVIVPPSEVRIRDSLGRTLNGLIGPFDEGSSLTIICEATDAKPRARVIWYQDGVMVDDSDLVAPDHPRRLVTNGLHIDSLDRSHLHATFTCQAQNVEKKSDRQKSLNWSSFSGVPQANTLRTANVTVDMNLPALDVAISSLRQPLSTKKNAEATCTSTGGRPPPQLTWWIDQAKLDVLGESVVYGDNFTTNTVTFLPEIDYDEKFLWCRAEAKSLSSRTDLEDSVILSVQYAPQLNLTLGEHISDSRALREGSDVYLDCRVRANPAVTEIRWKRDRKFLEMRRDEGVIISENSLVLQKVRRTSKGRYRCVASNSEGQSESNEIQLRIRFSPVCRDRQRLVYGIAAEEDADIFCNVEADPPPTKFTWTFNGTGVDEFDEKAFSLNGNRSTLTFRPRYAKSYGTLHCWATNQIGSQKEPCTYHVIAANPPEAIRSCVVANRTAVIQVKCKAGFAGGLFQIFHLEVFNFAFEFLEQNLTRSDEPIFDVANLTAGTQYIFVLYASNAKGRSPVFSLDVTTAAPEDPTPEGLLSSSVKAELLLLLAAVSALVVLTLMIIICVRHRRTRKAAREAKQRNKEDEEVQEVMLKHSQISDIRPKSQRSSDRPSSAMLSPEEAMEQLGKML